MGQLVCHAVLARLGPVTFAVDLIDLPDDASWFQCELAYLLRKKLVREFYGTRLCTVMYSPALSNERPLAIIN